jgi:hypothetical protein
LHIASPSINKENFGHIIQWADLFVGNTWTYISGEPIIDERTRRRYYGRAGEYRIRFYDEAKTLLGVEYRVLPGAVLHHPAYLNLMLHLLREAAIRAIEDGAPDEMWTDEVRNNINRADRVAAGYMFDDLACFGPSTMEQVESVRKIKARGLRLEPWLNVQR